MTLLSLAIAPVLIALFYIYIRDKYEKEPVQLLVVGVVFGLVVTFPIVFVGNLSLLLLPQNATLMGEAFFSAFITAAFVEEGFKYIILFFLTWRNRNLNEKFDGIVYAVFISLGFAFVENLLYVFSEDMGGTATALNRAVISIPGHGLFGVFMGYYFTLAKFSKKLERARYMALAFILPWMIHGIYNFLLLSNSPYFMFLAFLGILWYGGLAKMKKHINASPFK